VKFSFASKLSILFFTCSLLSGQTTQGLIAGRVRDEVNLGVIAGAHVTLSSANETLPLPEAETDKNGYFSFASLAPGSYSIRVVAASYRPSEVRGLVLPVSGVLIQNFNLRLLTDIWQTGISRSVFAGSESVLPIYGPDVDLSRSAYIERSPETRGELAPSLSRDISSEAILNLPLAARDPYALLVLQPNVTSDVTTVRGLGVSANGQRPSSSTFLLDGFQNNSYLTTGVFAVLPPEAIEEYRISINNFSAEFGGTSGYLGNAITRSSSNAWHGQMYADVTNQSWNAIDPQQELTGGPAPSQQLSFGTVAGGSLVHNRLFSTSSFAWDRSHSSSGQNLYTLPTQRFLSQLQPGSTTARLLAEFPGPIAPGSGDFGSLLLRPTISLDHVNALERLDFTSKDEKSHSFARLIADRLSQRDFIWSPYPAFTSGLDRNETGLGLSTSLTPRPNRLYEFRVGYTQDSIGWNRAHPEIPVLQTSTYTFGSPAGYTFHESGKTVEAASNFGIMSGPHAVKWGASYLVRWPEAEFSTPTWPIEYFFESADELISGNPSSFLFPLSRVALQAGNLNLPDLARNYRYGQLAAYIQDSYRLGDRFLLHVGLRYEYFSPPTNTGAYQDAIIRLGSGASMPERIQNATSATGGQIYNGDFKDWAPRIGFAYNITKDGGFILRASYGIFYDRPFDNLWLNVSLNDAVPASAPVAALNLNFLDSTASNLQKISQAMGPEQRASFAMPCNPSSQSLLLSVDCTSIDQTFFQPRFRSPYVQSFFGGLQKRITNSIAAEVEYAGSLGHELLTTDIINRSVPNISNCSFVGFNLVCHFRYNDQFGDLDYRGNQGSSSHHALVSSLSIRKQSLLLDFNYTWSHTIDNQSEPLAGFAANLAEVNLISRSVPLGQAAFTRQFDSGADRGNSSFDQRHVVASYFTWFLPSPSHTGKLRSLFGAWSLAGVGAIRSGSPFTVYARDPDIDGLFNNRADLILPEHATQDVPYPGGKLILNPAAFQQPAEGTLGTAGRNAFYGPGAFNLDLSLARTFVLPFSENWRLSVRADAFNLLNHPNLSNPTRGNDLCCGATPTFGFAVYGRSQTTAGLPISTALDETARQLHFVIRLTF
jgi:hypothetical protein